MLQVFYNTYGGSAIPAGGKGWRVAVPESTRQGRRGVLGRLWRQAQHPNTLVPQHAPHGPQHLLRPQLLPPLKARPEGMIANSEKGSKTIGNLVFSTFGGRRERKSAESLKKHWSQGLLEYPENPGILRGSKTIGKLGVFNFRGAARTGKCGIIGKASVPEPVKVF